MSADLQNRAEQAVEMLRTAGADDAWEMADVAWYPEKYTSSVYRYGVNYVLYAMTH